MLCQLMFQPDSPTCLRHKPALSGNGYPRWRRTASRASSTAALS